MATGVELVDQYHRRKLELLRGDAKQHELYDLLIQDYLKSFRYMTLPVSYREVAFLKDYYAQHLQV